MNNDQHFEPLPQIIRPERRPVISGQQVRPLYRQPAAEDAGLASYWHVLLKRRWTIAAIALGITLVVAVISLCMRPVYVATARLEVEPETPLLESMSDIYQRVDADD